MSNTLTIDTIATVFADYLNVVILDGIGGKNPETGPGATTYVTFVTDQVAPVLDKVRTWINNNWESAKVFSGATTDAEKLAMVPRLVLDNLARFEAPPKAVTPLHQAVENIIYRKFSHDPDIAKLTGSMRSLKFAPAVEKSIITGSVERNRAMIEAELVTIAATTGVRSRRDGSGASAPLNIDGLDSDD